MTDSPSEYDTAYNGLVSFRKRLFEELVSGRVKAQLDASHDTLNKYGDIIDSLSITPYMFSMIRQKALALTLDENDVDVGEVAQAKTNFVLSKSLYPISLPHNVAQRSLPQVDVFQYTPPTAVELFEKGSEEIWANLFVLQANKGTFIDVPDASNVIYDYYKLSPIGRVKFSCDLLSPEVGFDGVNKLKGEATILIRTLTKVGETIGKDYDFYAILDADFFSSSAVAEIVPLAMIVTHETTLLTALSLSVAGKHVLTTDKGVYCGWMSGGTFAGWTRTHQNYSNVSKETLYAKSVLLDIRVNDASMGTTDPTPAVYEKKATDTQHIDAVPNSGFAVKNWELNGTQYPSAVHFDVKCYVDHIVICMFWKGGTVTLRPNATGDLMQLKAEGDSPNYKCVDEEVSDGLVTFVWNNNAMCIKHDLYQIPDPTIPDGNIIDYVTIYARVRGANPLKRTSCQTLIKTNGMIYYGAKEYPPIEWAVISTKYVKNPYTNSAWTKSEVNALQIGTALENVQIISTGYPIDSECTQVWCEVVHHAP